MDQLTTVGIDPAEDVFAICVLDISSVSRINWFLRTWWAILIINHRLPVRHGHAISYFHAVICFARRADRPLRAAAP